MELLQLRYFRSAAKLQNFSRVAEQYMIPQSAVSKTISILEKELGCTLFDRIGKKVVLNERGKLLLKSVDAALNSLDDGILHLKNMYTQHIRVCVKAGSKLIPSLLADFQKIHPQTSFMIKKLNDCQESEFCFKTLPAERNEDHLPLLTEKIVLAIPHTHRLYNYPEIVIDDLLEEKFISLNSGHHIRQMTDQFCQFYHFKPIIAFETEDSNTFREMVQQQLGLAFVPEKAWNFNKLDHVKTMPIKNTDFNRTLIISWKKNAILSKNALEFRNFAVEWFSKV